MLNLVLDKSVQEHLKVFHGLEAIFKEIVHAGDMLCKAIENGHKIMICGNGGSAADSQHFAAELVGRFKRERNAMPAISLTTNTSIITALGNDYGYNTIFARQVEAIGAPGDLLIGISTSGASENVLKAFNVARSKDVATIGLLGKDGGVIHHASDISVIIPSDNTPHIQEAHIFILHAWCDMIEGRCSK